MKLVAIVLVVAAFALSLAVYNHLPERVPVHWNAAGQINSYASKMHGALIMPALMAVLAVVFAALPRISPATFDIDRDSRAFRAVTMAVLLFLFGVHVFIILAALNLAHSISTFLPLLLGALLVILGNYLPKIRRNFFIGIRTPWTLADEDVWFRTHRLGGVLFIACGALLMAVGPFVQGRWLEFFLIGIVVFVAMVLVIYSYAIYRRPVERPHQGEISS